MAANKLCDDLKLDKKTFIAHNEQLDNINAFKTNIKFDSDSILLKGNTFSAVNIKGGTGTHIFYHERKQRCSSFSVKYDRN